jgi:hypothetical protein
VKANRNQKQANRKQTEIKSEQKVNRKQKQTEIKSEQKAGRNRSKQKSKANKQKANRKC